MALFWFLLMIGPLVLFHELGHYLSARYFDVKCERFAIGMGPVVASIRRGETEFSIRALPLGGYVSMLGAQAEDEIPDEDRGRALTDKPVWQRMIIYFAGPLANFILAVPAFWLFAMGTPMADGPDVGLVQPGSAAEEAGLMPGDRIVEIDGREIRTFDQVQRRAQRSAGVPLAMVVERDGERINLTATPRETAGRDAVGLRTVRRGLLGILSARYPAIVDVPDGSPAHAAGLRTFDEVLTINGAEVTTWDDVEAALVGADAPVEVVVARTAPFATPYATLGLRQDVTITLPAGLRSSALRSARATIHAVQPGSPAANAGFQRGDRILAHTEGAPSVDTPGVGAVVLLERQLRAPEVGPTTVYVERDGAVVALELTPLTREVTGDMRTVHETTFSGLIGFPAAFVPMEQVRVPVGERAIRGARDAFTQTFEYLIGIFIGLALMITGQIDSANLGGPIMIADLARRAGAAGWLPFIRMSAVLSINLGVVNLAPIPGLDGGQLLLLTAEGIKREPLSFRARQIGAYAGVVCLVLLMLFAFKNDIERYWVPFANWLNS